MTIGEQNKCDVCFEGADGEVHRRLEGASLCLCGSRESIGQGAKRGTVILHEEVESGRHVRVVQGMQ